MIKNLIVLVIALMASTSLHSQWKIDKISLGFENGIKKDFNTITQNDGGYFLPAQHNWIGSRFLLGNYYYGGNATIFLKNKFLIDFGIYSHVVSDYYIFYIPELKKGSSSSGSSPYLKFVLGFGRDIKIIGRLFFQSSILLSYTLTDNEIDGDLIGNGIALDKDYVSLDSTYTYSKNNFFLGLRNTFQWKFNDRLNLNFGFSYNHGLQKFSKTNHTLYMTSAPETIYKGETISRLSHSTLFLSAQYSIWHADKKAQ
jgi:hypothetical protein